MVQCLAAFLDFCYIARRGEHDTISLKGLQDALDYYHELRMIFVEVGVCREGFPLPRQHSLVHYRKSIELFGSPNGLCSSITESKHIDAVKRTWRRSNRNDPIEQMTLTLTRLTKLASARVEFGRRGMLHGDVYNAAQLELGHDDIEDLQARKEAVYLARRDAQAAHDAFEHITLQEQHGGTSLPQLSYVIRTI